MPDTFNAASSSGTVAYSGSVGTQMPDESPKLESSDFQPEEGQTVGPIISRDVNGVVRFEVDVNGIVHLYDEDGNERLTLDNAGAVSVRDDSGQERITADSTGNISVLDADGQARVNIYDDFTVEFLDADNNRVAFIDADGYAEFAAIATAAANVTAAATINLDAALTSVFAWTPGESETINISNIANGQVITLIITTSGTSSFDLALATGFKSQGTLATGTVSGKVFVLQFIGFLTLAYECSNRTAM